MCTPRAPALLLASAEAVASGQAAVGWFSIGHRAYAHEPFNWAHQTHNSCTKRSSFKIVPKSTKKKVQLAVRVQVAGRSLARYPGGLDLMSYCRKPEWCVAKVLLFTNANWYSSSILVQPSPFPTCGPVKPVPIRCPSSFFVLAPCLLMALYRWRDGCRLGIVPCAPSPFLRPPPCAVFHRLLPAADGLVGCPVSAGGDQCRHTSPLALDPRSLPVPMLAQRRVWPVQRVRQGRRAEHWVAPGEGSGAGAVSRPLSDPLGLGAGPFCL